MDQDEISEADPPGRGPHPGFTWARYVEALVDEHGGWVGLSHELVRRARGPGVAANALSAATVEKGLRRLSARGNQAGGQYGRWLTRLFGLPAAASQRAKWMGQYHSRFADLPASMQ